MNEQLRKDIRAEIEKVKELKRSVGEINSHLNTIESLCTFDEEALERREKEAYRKGLVDAWEAARKIVRMPEGDLLNIFTECYSAVCTAIQVLLKYDASEAIAKLKAYDEKQKADDEIKVGDEVEVLNSGNKYLIAWFAGTSLCGFAHDGVTCRLQPSDVRKTGRHFDIEAILKEMES